MKRTVLISFLGAAGFHALLLFGFQVSGPVLQSVGDHGTTLDVALEGCGDAGADAGSDPAPEPAATPEPQPEPPEPAEPAPIVETPPTPSPTPEPDAPVATPTPVPTPKPQAAPRSLKPATSRRSAAPIPAERSGSGQGSGGGAGGRYASGTALNGNGGTPGAGGAQPALRRHPRPEYPPQARRERQEGVAFVKVRVGADGRPVDVALARSSGFPLLDEAAVRGVKRWTFDPAKVAGVPVSSQLEVPIRFNLVP